MLIPILQRVVLGAAALLLRLGRAAPIAWGGRLFLVVAVLACLAAPRLAAAQETSTPKPTPTPTPTPVNRPLRVFGYGGYTFSSIIRHGGTVSMVFSTARDSESRAAWGRGLQVTTTIGQNGYVVGSGWAMCSRTNWIGCIEARGIVGRTRTATDLLRSGQWYAGAEAGGMFVTLRFSAGVAFPLGESDSRRAMFFGSIGVTPPVFMRKWFK